MSAYLFSSVCSAGCLTAMARQTLCTDSKVKANPSFFQGSPSLVPEHRAQPWMSMLPSRRPPQAADAWLMCQQQQMLRSACCFPAIDPQHPPDCPANPSPMHGQSNFRGHSAALRVKHTAVDTLLPQIGQLFQIFQILGTPDSACWPGVAELPDWQACFPAWPPKDLSQVIPGS